MVYHSHYLVTDKKTGVVHSLCCYKECNARIVTDDDVFEKKDNTLLTKSKNSLSRYKKNKKTFENILMSDKKRFRDIPIILDSSEDEDEKDNDADDDDKEDDECMEIDEAEFSRTIHMDESLPNNNIVISPTNNSNSGTD